jgi:hypothetical protein
LVFPGRGVEFLASIWAIEIRAVGRRDPEGEANGSYKPLELRCRHCEDSHQRFSGGEYTKTAFLRCIEPSILAFEDEETLKNPPNLLAGSQYRALLHLI